MHKPPAESVNVSEGVTAWSQKFQANVEFVRRDEPTHVFVVAVHADPTRNRRLSIPTKRGIAIGGYTYDTMNECYLVRGVDVIDLDVVPASFRLEVRGAMSWTSDVPMPEPLLREFLTGDQDAKLRKFVKAHESYARFDYVQMLGNA